MKIVRKEAEMSLLLHLFRHYYSLFIFVHLFLNKEWQGLSVILGPPSIYLHCLFFSSLLVGYGSLQLALSHTQAQHW